MNIPHILIADNEENLLHSIKFILKAAHYKVTTVRDGKRALKTILSAEDSDAPISLLIADLQMSKLSGLELINELQRLEVNIPILVISRFGDRKLKSKLKPTGFREFLDKPFDSDDLLKKVKKLLKK